MPLPTRRRHSRCTAGGVGRIGRKQVIAALPAADVCSSRLSRRPVTRLRIRPIGMQDYQPSDGECFRGADSEHPAYPIRMSARDLARFALLYLHEGSWKGRQIIPSGWGSREHAILLSRVFRTDVGLGLRIPVVDWVPSDMGAPTVNVPARSFVAFAPRASMPS
jgi:CubicO group peptidase (beta-lactamase class C family)